MRCHTPHSPVESGLLVAQLFGSPASSDGSAGGWIALHASREATEPRRSPPVAFGASASARHGQSCLTSSLFFQVEIRKNERGAEQFKVTMPDPDAPPSVMTLRVANRADLWRVQHV